MWLRGNCIALACDVYNLMSLQVCTEKGKLDNTVVYDNCIQELENTHHVDSYDGLSELLEVANENLSALIQQLLKQQ